MCMNQQEQQIKALPSECVTVSYFFHEPANHLHVRLNPASERLHCQVGTSITNKFCVFWDQTILVKIPGDSNASLNNPLVTTIRLPL